MENSPLALFEHEKFGSLRVVRSDQGAQWFVAKDVCGCLGLDTSNLSKMLDEDELSTYPVQYTDQVRNLSVVSEPGLYSLILRSRKPEAKAFKRWVTHEVIPSIRKVGGYLIAKPDDTPEAILARAVLVAQDTIRRIEAERDEAIRTKAEIGSRREATAMATASAAVRKATALENELGRGRDYKSVKGIPWFLDVFADTPAAYSVGTQAFRYVPPYGLRNPGNRGQPFREREGVPRRRDRSLPAGPEKRPEHAGQVPPSPCCIAELCSR